MHRVDSRDAVGAREALEMPSEIGQVTKSIASVLQEIQLRGQNIGG